MENPLATMDAILDGEDLHNNNDDSFCDDSNSISIIISEDEESDIEPPDLISSLIITKVESIKDFSEDLPPSTVTAESSSTSIEAVTIEKKKITFSCKNCSFTSNTRFSLARHESMHNQSRIDESSRPTECVDPAKKNFVFKCNYCSFSSKIRFALQRHVTTHTEKADSDKDEMNGLETCKIADSASKVLKPNYKQTSEALKCSYCPFIGKSERSLVWHLQKFHKEHNFKCKYCDRIVPEQGRIRHMKQTCVRGGNLLLYCSLCSFATKYKSVFKKHKKSHIVLNRPIVKCDKCDYKSFQINVARHRVAFHQRNKKLVSDSVNDKNKNETLNNNNNNDQVKKIYIFKCDRCSFASKIRFALQRHMITHTEKADSDKDETKVTETFKVTDSASKVLQPNYKQTSEALKCSYCPFIGKTKRSLVFHLQKSHKEHNYKCEHCHRLVPEQWREKHMEQTCLQGVGQIYHCPSCSFTTKYFDSLRKHKKLHIVLKRPIVKCDKCDYKSVQRIVDKHKIVFHKTNKKLVSNNVNNEENKKNETLNNNNGQVKQNFIFKCDRCSFTSKIRFALQRHKMTHSEKADADKEEIKVTETCKVSDSARKVLESNYEQISETLKCNYCPFTTKTKQGLHWHLLKFHKEHNFKCVYCGKAVTEQRRIRHMTETCEWCEWKLLQCPWCSFTTKYTKSLKLHKNRHTIFNMPIYKCDKCDYKSFQYNINKHKIAFHQKNNKYVSDSVKKENKDESLNSTDGQVKSPMTFTCEICSFSAKTRFALNRHKCTQAIVALSQLVKWKCLYCSYSGLSQYALLNHMQTTHKDQLEKCSTCDGETFQNNHKFCIVAAETGKVSHVQETSENGTDQTQSVSDHPSIAKLKIFTCNLCSYTCKNLLSLRRHKKMSHKSKETVDKVKCDNCAYQTADLNNFFWHEIECYAKKPIETASLFQCQICSFKTATERALKIHDARKHKTTVVKKSIEPTAHLLECKICQFKTVSKETLKKHNGLKHRSAVKNSCATLKCKLCEFKGTWNAVSKHFKTIHQKNTIIWCKFCSFGANTAKRMQQHMTTHTGPRRKIYHCSECDYKSTHLSMVCHYRIAHSIRFKPLQDKIEKIVVTKNHTANNIENENADQKRKHFEEELKKQEENEEEEEELKKQEEEEEDFKYTCQLCPFRTNYAANIRKHLSKHVICKETFFKCTKCGVRVKKEKLKAHSTKEHRALFSLLDYIKIIRTKAQSENTRKSKSLTDKEP